jgi:cephalosporin hydroxylase
VILIDEKEGWISPDNGESRLPFASKEGFELMSKAWLRATWDAKYVYNFTWMGRPIIQLPDDLIRLQELIWQLKPDVIVETGVAHGGSLIFHASLLQIIRHGRVIGVDIEIRPHNRKAIEEHTLAPSITLIEGSSVAPETVEKVKSLIAPGESVLVILDAKHTKDHVLAELTAYSPLVNIGSYILACDGIMELVDGAPRSERDWPWNNPRQAALQFVEQNPNFRIEEPALPFCEGILAERVSYWPDSYIKRVAR